jgi:hypothetical protein
MINLSYQTFATLNKHPTTKPVLWATSFDISTVRQQPMHSVLKSVNLPYSHYCCDNHATSFISHI